MTNSSSDGVLSVGMDDSSVSEARMDLDLRAHLQGGRAVVDPRLLDPRLARVADELAAPVREQARTEGYAAGWAQGRREANERLQQELARHEEASRQERARQSQHAQAALSALAAATRRLEQQHTPPSEEVAAAAAELAVTLCQAILGRELAVATDPGREAIARALDLAPRNRPVVVRLHPADLAAIGAGTSEIDGRQVTLVADPSLASGDGIAECDATLIDARLGAALERVAAVLMDGVA